MNVTVWRALSGGVTKVMKNTSGQIVVSDGIPTFPSSLAAIDISGVTQGCTFTPNGYGYPSLTVPKMTGTAININLADSGILPVVNSMSSTLGTISTGGKYFSNGSVSFVNTGASIDFPIDWNYGGAVWNYSNFTWGFKLAVTLKLKFSLSSGNIVAAWTSDTYNWTIEPFLTCNVVRNGVTYATNADVWSGTGTGIVSFDVLKNISSFSDFSVYGTYSVSRTTAAKPWFIDTGTVQISR